MGFLDPLTNSELRKLDDTLFSGLTKTTDEAMWDDTADIITHDIRATEIKRAGEI